MRRGTKKARNFIQSFNYAAEGVLYALKTQHNMRIHALMALLVLIVALSLGVSREEVGLLILTIGVVMVTEMVNTAIEAAVDLATSEYHPLAKVAKNVAAGAALIAAVASLVVGYLVFFHRLAALAERPVIRVDAGGEAIVLIALAAVIVLVVLVKAGATPFRIQGGFPSAHSALAFSLATLIYLLSAHGIVSLLGLGIAVLVGQARVETGVHTLFEVVAGALVGILVTVLAFQILVS